MKNKRRKNGFSLTEVLMAISILGIAMVFVGGLFPVGMQLSKKSSEQTIAAIIADEAFAKIKLYAKDKDGNPMFAANFAGPDLESFQTVLAHPSPDIIFDYPSTYTTQLKQYCWSAICRRFGLTQVHVTVFVCKKLGPAAAYWGRDNSGNPISGFVLNPEPIWVDVDLSPTNYLNELAMINYTDQFELTFINDGWTIISDATGQSYRVLERDADFPDRIILDRNWDESLPGRVWAIPPVLNSGQNLCIGVYQKVIEF